MVEAVLPEPRTIGPEAWLELTNKIWDHGENSCLPGVVVIEETQVQPALPHNYTILLPSNVSNALISQIYLEIS